MEMERGVPREGGRGRGFRLVSSLGRDREREREGARQSVLLSSPQAGRG